jgi:hypothetical protein
MRDAYKGEKYDVRAGGYGLTWGSLKRFNGILRKTRIPYAPAYEVARIMKMDIAGLKGGFYGQD